MEPNQQYSRVAGVVTEDPAAEPQAGMRLQFSSVAVLAVFPERTASLRNWDFFNGVLLSMSFADSKAHSLEGSAVLVAPGIALCATHVIEPYLEDLLASRVSVMCQGITPAGLQLWQIRKVTIAPDSDVAILGLVLASAIAPGHVFLQARITTRTPRIGEELLICGFRSAEDSFLAAEGGVIYEGNVRVSRGPITAVYPNGRDRAVLPWPVLEVSCPTLGGMSGGPVFDATGHLVGLLCSGIDTEDGEGVSYVSLLWPTLMRKFEAVWPIGFFQNPLTLHGMDRRLCYIDRPEALSLLPHPSGTGEHIAYTIWEDQLAVQPATQTGTSTAKDAALAIEQLPRRPTWTTIRQRVTRWLRKKPSQP